MCEAKTPNNFCIWIPCHECKREVHQEEWPILMHNGHFFCSECARTSAERFLAERGEARAAERKRILQKSWQDFWRVVWAYVANREP